MEYVSKIIAILICILCQQFLTLLCMVAAKGHAGCYSDKLNYVTRVCAGNIYSCDFDFMLGVVMQINNLGRQGQ